MKKIIFILLFAICLCSCAEDHIGQTPIDHVGPAVIQNVEIEAMPGGAKITYDLPKETDISYVKGVYRVKGVEYVVRSSIYKNYLLVEGLGNTELLEVTLYSVDHSENLSEPVVTKITPGTPLVELIFQSMKVATDFGGIKVTWDNILSSEIGITVLSTDEKGNMVEGETLFTALKNGEYSFRGYDDITRTFAVYLTDKWGNVSDTLKQEITPYFEKILDKSKHKRLTLPMDNTTQNGALPFYRIFDDVTTGLNGWSTAGEEGQLPGYFTVDLGVTCKLSRFKLWQIDNGWYFTFWNIKGFEIWGTDNYKQKMDEKYWMEEWKSDWEQLGDCLVPKPSGVEGAITNEDKDAAASGYEYIIPLEKKNCRYVRFVVKTLWGGGINMMLSELSFYGNDK